MTLLERVAGLEKKIDDNKNFRRLFVGERDLRDMFRCVRALERINAYDNLLPYERRGASDFQTGYQAGWRDAIDLCQKETSAALWAGRRNHD